MLGIIKTLWPIISGIGLYAGIMHLQIGLRRPIDRLHTLFGILALVLAFAVFGNILLSSAQTLHQYLIAAWYSSVLATSVFIVLPWFISCYAGNSDHRPAAILSGIYVIVLIGNFFHPYSMLQSGPPVLQQVTFSWGESVTRSLTPATQWSKLLWAAHVITVLYIALTCLRAFTRGPRPRAWALTFSAGILAVSLFVNILVVLGVINFPFVAAPGFLAMIFVMSVALTHEWRRSHEQLRRLLDNVPAAVYLKSLNGRYLFVNRHFARLYRREADAMLGKTDSDLFAPDRAELHSRADKEALTAGALESEEVIELDGNARTYASSRYALRDADGSTYALCGIATDITDRKVATDVLRDLSANLERRVARRTNELAQLNGELEAFAYSVSHDLRAPLTAVNGFAELLLREHGPKLDQSAQRYLNRIRDGSLRMAALIQDLLGLSRVTQQTLEREQTDLAPLIDATIRSLREHEPTRTVTITAPANLPANCDAKLLSVALNNLLSNAWKYTSKTHDARIEIGAIEQNGETIYFVKDNGAGFNAEHADRLFRPFVRLHADSEFPGTGIGLATVARIVNRHGGRIWATAKLSEGATFFLTLPAPEEEDFSSTTIVRSSGM